MDENCIFFIISTFLSQSYLLLLIPFFIEFHRIGELEARMPKKYAKFHLTLTQNKEKSFNLDANVNLRYEQWKIGASQKYAIRKQSIFSILSSWYFTKMTSRDQMFWYRVAHMFHPLLLVLKPREAVETYGQPCSISAWLGENFRFFLQIV